ncbi:MAG: MHYT domain-containing protein, partial [Pseudomonadota bacterium]
GFTGLSLTQGIAKLALRQRKVSIALASVALGGGIWSMHFVAMLGLQLPFIFYYDAAITLASALVAILVVGIALLILHFLPRTPKTLTSAGLIVGLGIVAMHYLGMSGLELCRAVYAPSGLVVAVLASSGLSTLAIWVAYGRRNQQRLLIATLVFGLAVFSVHFVAIAGTEIVQVEQTTEFGPLISNETLALGVIISSFVLCGAFLLTGVTVLVPGQHDDPASETARMSPETAGGPIAAHQIPFERDGHKQFVDSGSVAAIQADGHYTQIYTATGKLFCSWSISEAEARLAGNGFIKSHRSYLINPDFVDGFERHKDNAVCRFERVKALGTAPVSRSHLKSVRDALGV